MDYDDDLSDYSDSESYRFMFCISFKGIKSLEQMIQNINSRKISFDEYWMSLGLLANETPVIVYDFLGAVESGILDTGGEPLNEDYCIRKIDNLENSEYKDTDEVVKWLNLREARVLVDPEEVKRMDKIDEEFKRTLFD